MPPGRAPPLRPGPQRARDGRGHPASRRGSPVGALQRSGGWAGGCRPAPHLSATCVSALGPGLPRWCSGRPACLPSGLGSPGDARGKEPACQFRRHKRRRFDTWVRKVPREGKGSSLQHSYWKIPRTEEPGRLQPTESQRVGHGLARSSTQSCSCKCWAGGGPPVGCPRSLQLPSHIRGGPAPHAGGSPGGGHLVPHRSGEACPQEVPVSSGRERRGCHHAMQAMGDLALCVSPSWRHA